MITRDPNRQANLRSSTSCTLTTLCEKISADGHVLPPMIIVSGMIHQEYWYTKTDIHDDYLIGVSDTSYSNDYLTIAGLKQFEMFLACPQSEVYRLLLLDCYGSHCTREFIEYYDDYKIIPFCLPSNTSYLLQLLDVLVFHPYKHYNTKAIEATTRPGCRAFDKVEFLIAINSI